MYCIINSLLFSLLNGALAVPTSLDPLHALVGKGALQGCPVESITVPLRGQSLAVPSGETTSLIALGRGVQNYTCVNSAYVSDGALANLYDVGCFFSRTDVDAAFLSATLPSLAVNYLAYPDGWTFPVIAKHYFVKLPNAASASPGFFAANDKVVASRVKNVKAIVDPAHNVDWLQLVAVTGQGTLAKSVFRIDTAGGQPPVNCSAEGSSLSVPYAAMYWFTK